MSCSRKTRHCLQEHIFCQDDLSILEDLVMYFHSPGEEVCSAFSEGLDNKKNLHCAMYIFKSYVESVNVGPT